MAGLPGSSVRNSNSADNFLRLHVRANSNSQTDQDIKYVVKSAIVDALTPLMVDVISKEQAMQKLNANLGLIESVADSVLESAGFDYGCRAQVRSEYFPTRDYNQYTLPEGVYDALIVELGTGTGDNWWCVVYPPLCFLENNIGGDTGVKYRSKLEEIIKRYF